MTAPHPTTTSGALPAEWLADPDRTAPTLAVRAAAIVAGARVAPVGEPFAEERVVASDARVDLRLARWRTEALLAEHGTPAAKTRLAGLDTPQLRAGLVRDGTARGLLVAYEEARSLCKTRPKPAARADDDVVAGLDGRAPSRGRDLRRLRDAAIASGGSRIRWTRREGLLLVDRRSGLHAPGFLTFEDRRDLGDLDAFRPADDRPRYYVPQSLRPRAFVESGDHTELVLVGRLGRGAWGFPCRLRIVGRADAERVLVEIAIDNRHDDHRLRVRFRGLDDSRCVHSEGSPHAVATVAGSRIEHALTLVRACSRLRIAAADTDAGPRIVAVPGANCHGVLVHRLWIGAADAPVPAPDLAPESFDAPRALE